MQFTDEDILAIIETYSPGESLYHLTRLIQETEEELDPDYGWETPLGTRWGLRILRKYLLREKSDAPFF